MGAMRDYCLRNLRGSMRVISGRGQPRGSTLACVRGALWRVPGA